MSFREPTGDLFLYAGLDLAGGRRANGLKELPAFKLSLRGMMDRELLHLALTDWHRYFQLQINRKVFPWHSAPFTGGRLEPS